MSALAYKKINANQRQASAFGEVVVPLSKSLPLATFAASTEIFAPGQAALNVYQVEFGAVRVYRLLADGRRQVIAFHLAGESFGLEAGGMHQLFAETIIPSGLRIVPLDGAGRQQIDIAALALQAMASAQNHIMLVSRLTAVERISAFLLDMANRQGGLDHFDLPMSRLDMADYLDLTIETVSRVLAKLRSAGLIRLRSIRRVEIMRPEDLYNISA
ncbi:MAG: helix-turn-helix domain-containing protein [Neorhizobium sp.]|jgi:CRP/FNR family nitrogen fixation transcriptional regulator|nr:helix-turn-helix domain-containing protein [Neorhizobium sp.]